MKKRKVVEGQARFSDKGELQTARTKVEMDFSGKTFNCPYCLFEAPIGDFLLRKKQGWSEKRAQCPDCNNIFHMKNLTRHMTLTEYAQWILDASSFGGFHRIKWPKIKERLNQQGIKDLFFKEYYRLKWKSRSFQQVA